MKSMSSKVAVTDISDEENEVISNAFLADNDKEYDFADANAVYTRRLHVKEKQFEDSILNRLRRWRDGMEPYIPELNKIVLHEQSVIQELMRPLTIFWMSWTLALLSLWLKLTVIFWPTDPDKPLYGHFIMFYSHIVFMDLVPNFATGYLLHKINCLKNNCHKKEHELTKSGELWCIFFITTLYGLYTLFFMCAWGLIVACPQEKGCFHWNSAMWIASFSYTVVGLSLRLTLYTARRKPILYSSSKLILNMARFYWAHFHFKEWESYSLFGAQTPFWDVIFGTCPYNIPYSTPIPFLDFFVTDEKVFMKAKNPRAYKWTLKQKIYHMTWAVVVFSLVTVVLPFVML
jgi:hypothetical protein